MRIGYEHGRALESLQADRHSRSGQGGPVAHQVAHWDPDAWRSALASHKPELLVLHSMRVQLRIRANHMGIPRAIVDTLPVEELETTAEQIALAADYRGRNGGSMTQSLLLFYLRYLADRGPNA